MEKTSKLGRDGAFWGLVMVAPTVIGLIVLNIYPFIDTIYMSFSKSLPFGEFEFEGIENYVEMFQSPEFWQATWNTIFFCILTVPVGIFLALLVAVLLNSKIKGAHHLPRHLLPAHGGGPRRRGHGLEVDLQHPVRHHQPAAERQHRLADRQPDRPDHLLGGSRSGATSATTPSCCWPACRTSRSACTRPPTWTARPRCASSSASPCRWSLPPSSWSSSCV